MKLLCLCNLVPAKYGAFEKLLAAMVSECRKHGDEMIVGLAGEPAKAVADEWRMTGMEWRLVPGWTDARGREHPWRFVRPALRLVCELKPDLVVLNFGNEYPALIAAAITQLCCRPRPRWIWQQHQQVCDPAGPARLFSRIGLLRLAFDHFATQYEGGRQSLLRRGIPRSNTSAIFNGVPEPSRTREPGWLRRELGIGPETPVAVTVGALIRRKRIEFQLGALAKVIKGDSVPACVRLRHGMQDSGGRNQITDDQQPANLITSLALDSESSFKFPVSSFPQLLIIGDGPERRNLERRAGEMGVAEQVRFLGLRNDIPDILFEADLYLHSAVAETCTYAITEAMAAGIPAIATEAGAAREQIEDGVSGYIIARDDQAGFVTRFDELLRDPRKRRSMGEAARMRWDKGFRLEATIKQYYELYHKITAKSGRREDEG